MNTLSGLDALFLYLETPETPMHIGTFSLYERPKQLKGSLRKAIQAHIGQRLHLVPVFTRKLQLMPLDLGHPAWRPVDDVDLDVHIRPATRKTVTVDEAEAICAKLHSQLMDRSRPLWQFHVFEHIQRQEGILCAGLYIKIHHAALDGKGGTVLINAITDVGPAQSAVSPRGPRKNPNQRGPGVAEMIGSILSTSATQYLNLVEAVPQAAKAFGRTLIEQSFSQPREGLLPKPPVQLAPLTDFNVAVTPLRSFGTARMPFAECRAMAKNVNATFNDIALWICATALRTYLEKHGGIPEKSLLAAMPINLREQGNQEFNTQASMTVVELGTQFSDPLERLKTIMASTIKVKNARNELKDVIPTDFPPLLAPWIVGGAAKAAFKVYSSMGLSHRLPMMANLVISNVPGPTTPLYLAGCKMLTFHPLSIVIHGIALNITIQTFAGEVDFGVIADKKALPEVKQLTDALLLAFEAGKKVMVPTQKPASSRKSKKTSI